MSKLEKEIQNYVQEGNYPFHMPGHKRKAVTDADLPYAIDMTEIPATDDLHDASGILKEAMDRTAKLYGVKRTWYLVNGSTCGNLAGVFALTHQGGEVIAARNCHISVYHALQLRGLHVHWLMPQYDSEFGIYTGVDPKEVETLLEQYPKSECVILTSPTYEGVVSDIASIASLCHARNCSVFVDEAHGAHFSLEHTEGEHFPLSASTCGADLVVQSAHKTLPSLTQTAWLHRNTERVSDTRVEKMLHIFETSSPSYPLMVAMDACTEFIEQKGEEAFAMWHANLNWFQEQVQDLRHLKVLKKKETFYALDASKLWICVIDRDMTGAQLAQLLRSEYHVECEMCAGDGVLCMTACTDEKEAYAHLASVLHTIDQKLEALPTKAETDSFYQNVYQHLPRTELTLMQASEEEQEEIDYRESEDQICGEYLYLYPPGIPFLIPGERIGKQVLQEMEELQKKQIKIHFSDSEEPGKIRVVKR